MSNIAVAIDKLINECEPPMTGAELARASGIQEAQISRIRNGRQIWMNPDDMTKIALTLCKGDLKSKRLKKIHARLLHARMLDECTGPGADLITITLAAPPHSRSPQKGTRPAHQHPERPRHHRPQH